MARWVRWRRPGAHLQGGSAAGPAPGGPDAARGARAAGRKPFPGPETGSGPGGLTSDPLVPGTRGAVPLAGPLVAGSRGAETGRLSRPRARLRPSPRVALASPLAPEREQAVEARGPQARTGGKAGGAGPAPRDQRGSRSSTGTGSSTAGGQRHRDAGPLVEARRWLQEQFEAVTGRGDDGAGDRGQPGGSGGQEVHGPPGAGRGMPAATAGPQGQGMEGGPGTAAGAAAGPPARGDGPRGRQDRPGTLDGQDDHQRRGDGTRHRTGDPGMAMRGGMETGQGGAMGPGGWPLAGPAGMASVPPPAGALPVQGLPPASVPWPAVPANLLGPVGRGREEAGGGNPAAMAGPGAVVPAAGPAYASVLPAGWPVTVPLPGGPGGVWGPGFWPGAPGAASLAAAGMAGTTGEGGAGEGAQGGGAGVQRAAAGRESPGAPRRVRRLGGALADHGDRGRGVAGRIPARRLRARRAAVRRAQGPAGRASTRGEWRVWRPWPVWPARAAVATARNKGVAARAGAGSAPARPRVPGGVRGGREVGAPASLMADWRPVPPWQRVRLGPPVGWRKGWRPFTPVRPAGPLHPGCSGFPALPRRCGRPGWTGRADRPA